MIRRSGSRGVRWERVRGGKEEWSEVGAGVRWEGGMV